MNPCLLGSERYQDCVTSTKRAFVTVSNPAFEFDVINSADDGGKMVARFRPHKRSDALNNTNKNSNSIIPSIRRPVYYLMFVIVLVASTIQSTFTTTTAQLLFEKSFKTDQTALPEHQVSTYTIPWSITETAKMATEPSLSDVLDSEEYFVRNSHNLTFQTHVRVWKDTAKLCLDITLNDPQRICPFPSFRARLSGAAIVNVPLDVEHGSEIDADRFDDKPHGCILFPVTGTYHLDVVLLHCTMNAWPRNVSSHDLRKLCPVLPEARENVSIYNITVEPFERNDDVVSLLWPARNPFPRRAFVFAPRCLGIRNAIGAHCTNESTAVPPVLRVDYQTNRWNIKPKQFQNYVYLEVNPKNGAVNYDATFTLPRLAAPPKDFASDETVCFLGDSHARYVSYQTRVIYQNKVGGKTGCNDKHLHTGHESTSGQFRYGPMNFGNDFLNNPMINSTLFDDCNLVFILYGHWDAVSPCACWCLLCVCAHLFLALFFGRDTQESSPQPLMTLPRCRVWSWKGCKTSQRRAQGYTWRRRTRILSADE